uniref:F-box domain-containing protein n=1 Tax=Mycena chlorophos TaxID=658473 RepID=A0ABQ0LNY7_MYCCL|nr:predicted protein [Mycena chlorophos]
MNLDELPPELLTHIVELSCTDNGATGRSLSLVSRYIRDISATFKLQSVALLGRQQQLQFAAFLDSTDDSMPANTRYLYIGGQESESELAEIVPAKREGYAAANAKAITFARANPGEEHYKQLQLLRDQVQDMLNQSHLAIQLFAREAADAVFTILRHVAPTLEVLYIHVNEYVARALNQSGLELPRLVDLTTCAGFPLIRHKGQGESGLLPCPTLRHLHVVETNDMWCESEAFLRVQGIAHFAPNLTTLRLSELGQNEAVPLHVAASIGIDIGGTQYTPLRSIVPLPRSVQQIVLKPTVKPEPACCEVCDDTYVYSDLVDYARRLVQKSSLVVLLRADKEAPERDYLFTEWLDKANGRSWIWDEKDVDTTPPKTVNA